MENDMKSLLILLPLAACTPHMDPCLRVMNCNPAIEDCTCHEMASSDRGPADAGGPDFDGDGNGNGSHSGEGSSDDNGDVSDD
jgi:hypothetical protein